MQHKDAMSASIYISLMQDENGPMRLRVLCECDGQMQESAPCLSASSLVRLGECPASRVEDCGKHSNVRLKMIIISLTHIHKNAIMPYSTFLTDADYGCTVLKLPDRVFTTTIST
jgi:hypothetical protein